MTRFPLFRLHRLQIHWEKQSSLIKAVFQIKPIYWSRQSQLSSVFRSLCFKVYICSIFWLQHYYHIFMGSGQRSVSGLCLISFRTKLLLTFAVFLCIHHSKLVFILLRKLIVWFIFLCQQVAGIQIGDTFWFCRTTRRYSCRYVECFLSFIIKEWNAVLLCTLRMYFPLNAAYLFPSSLSPEILEGLLGSGSHYYLFIRIANAWEN